MERVLQVEGVTTGYQKPVVFDANVTIPTGKMTALIGPNGCGKSTLLKCMARLLKPHQGEVRLHGSPVHQQPTALVAKQLALLPQGPTAPEGLTVRALVAQGRYPHQSLFRQWSEQDQIAVESAMVMTDTLAIADRPIAELSGGQRQRCWIAMVLAQETPVILLDEPTSYLDMRVQVDLLNLLTSLAHNQGRTLVVVLHELNLAAAFADHLVLMKAGRIQTQGTADEVFTEQHLADVFGLKAHVIKDPYSGRPMCVPKNIPQSAAAQQPRAVPASEAMV